MHSSLETSTVFLHFKIYLAFHATILQELSCRTFPHFAVLLSRTVLTFCRTIPYFTVRMLKYRPTSKSNLHLAELSCATVFGTGPHLVSWNFFTLQRTIEILLESPEFWFLHVAFLMDHPTFYTTIPHFVGLCCISLNLPAFYQAIFCNCHVFHGTI